MFPSFNARALGLDLTAAETIGLAHEAGFGGVDLLVRDLADRGESPRELRRRMDDLGLRPGAWPLPVDWRGPASKFRDDLAALPRLAAIAQELGLARTGTWVVPQAPAPTPDDPEPLATLHAWHVDRLDEIARVLEAHGTRLGLEALGMETVRSGAGPAYGRRLGDLSQLQVDLNQDSLNVGWIVDTYHAAAAGETEAIIGWLIKEKINSVVWVHVANPPLPSSLPQSAWTDADRLLPHEGLFQESLRILGALIDSGYDGPVTAEPLATCRSLAGNTPRGKAEQVMASWQALMIYRQQAGAETPGAQTETVGRAFERGVRASGARGASSATATSGFDRAAAFGSISSR